MKSVRILAAVLFFLAAAYWIAFKKNWLPQQPAIFASLVSLLLVLLIFVLANLLREIVRKEGKKTRGTAKILSLSGIICMGIGGLATWLWSIQGLVILYEGDAIPFRGASHLQILAQGPLANPSELPETLLVQKIDFLPRQAGMFVPQTTLQILSGQETKQILLLPNQVSSWEKMNFYQGAFGFAPRIVVLKEGRSIFDETIPFTTRREGASGVAFEGEFEIPAEKLLIRSAIDLSRLDAQMQGHPKIGVIVKQNGQQLTSGELAPGYFSEIGQDYSIGFAGLKKWSEIDFSRRGYPGLVQFGFILFACGLFWQLGLLVIKTARRTR